MNLLVALDGAPQAELVVPWVLELARSWAAQLVLVRVVDDVSSATPDLPPSLLQRLQEKSLQEAQEYLRSLCDRLQGLSVRILTPTGNPAAQLGRAARQENCDLLVMASHGRTGATRWLLGSVAEKVLRQTTCPVLLLRPEGPQQWPFEHILIAVDGSEVSLGVVPQVLPYLAPGGRVTLLQVVDVSLMQQLAGWLGHSIDLHQEQIRERLQQVRLERVPLHVEVLMGPPASTLVDYARAKSCDLIAMSTHGRSGFHHLWLGSVTEKVAGHCHTPVLIFPHPGGLPGAG
jgi:nucleotide-binding universal stress UspA family protein